MCQLPLLVLLWIGALLASGNVEAAVEPPPLVRITLIGRVSAESTLSGRIAGWFNTKTRVEVLREEALVPLGGEPPIGEPAVLVRIVVRHPEAVRIYFKVSTRRASDPRYLVREVAIPSGLDEIGLERIAQVVHSAALALWEGREQSSREEFERLERDEQKASITPISPQVAPASIATKPSPVESDVDRRNANGPLAVFALKAAYGLMAQGQEGLAHGPNVGIEWLAFERWGFGVDGEFWWARTVSSERVRLELSGGAIFARAGWWPRLSARLSGEVHLGLGAHWVHFGPRGVESNKMPGSDETEARPVLRGGLGLHAALARAFSLGLTLRLDQHLSNTYYYVESAGVQTRVITPWRLQPGTLVTFKWTITPD